MLLKLAIRSRTGWVRKLVYFSQAPLVLLLSVVGARAGADLLGRLVGRVGRPTIGRIFEAAVPLVYLSLAAAIVILCFERLYRYRASDFLAGKLARCRETIDAPGLRIERGEVVAELLLGPLHAFARYWRYAPTFAEFVPLMYLQSYRGLLRVIEDVKNERGPLEGRTLMTFVTPLRDVASRPGMVASARALPVRLGLHMRILLAIALRVSPFGRALPAARTRPRRVYFRASALVGSEAFFRAEAARLERLTARILERKRGGGKSNARNATMRANARG